VPAEILNDQVSLRGNNVVTIDVRPVSRLSARDDICAKFRESAASFLRRQRIARLEDRSWPSTSA